MYGKKRDQIGILELENTITKVKISLQVFNSVLEDAEERISKLKDRTIKVSSLRSRKKEKKSEQSLRDCGMQLSKPIHVVWIYQKEKRERSRSMYLQINGWKLPKFDWRHESTHLRKKENYESSRGEMTHHIQENLSKINGWFFHQKPWRPEGSGMIYLKGWKKEKTLSTENSISSKTVLQK